MMFAIVFGLSMDYEVFLLSRILETGHRTGDNTRSVGAGLSATGRATSSAAFIMTAVFLSFTASPTVVVKMLAVGLAVSVVPDATIVRLVLVPSTMFLVGRANWWVPRRLDRVLPRVSMWFPGGAPGEPGGTRQLPRERSAPRAAPIPSEGQKLTVHHMGDDMATGGATPWWKSESFKVSLAVAVITGVLGVVLGWFSPDSSSGTNDSRASVPTTVVSAGPPTSDAATDSPTPSDTAPSPTASERATPPASGGVEAPPGGQDPGDDESSDPSTVPPQPDILYLSNLDPIGGLGNWKKTGSAEMRQRTYGNSVVFTPNYFNSSRLDLTYNVPSGMKYFVATVGLDDRTTPGATVFFQVERNENPVDSGFTMGVDGKKELRLSVAGAQRVTIIIEVTKRGPDAVNSSLHAVWGDARFTVG